jgi:hypothetical protein
MASLHDTPALPLVNSRLSKDRTDYAAQLLRWSASLDVRRDGNKALYTFDDYCKKETTTNHQGDNT